MNTNTLVAAFIVVVSGLIWIGTQSNDTGWAGNRNQCVGECYEEWKAENGGSSSLDRRPWLRRKKLLLGPAGRQGCAVGLGAG
mgnify:CR=1 FL=1